MSYSKQLLLKDMFQIQFALSLKNYILLPKFTPLSSSAYCFYYFSTLYLFFRFFPRTTFPNLPRGISSSCFLNILVSDPGSSLFPWPLAEIRDLIFPFVAVAHTWYLNWSTFFVIDCFPHKNTCSYFHLHSTQPPCYHQPLLAVFLSSSPTTPDHLQVLPRFLWLTVRHDVGPSMIQTHEIFDTFSAV